MEATHCLTRCASFTEGDGRRVVLHHSALHLPHGAEGPLEVAPVDPEAVDAGDYDGGPLTATATALLRAAGWRTSTASPVIAGRWLLTSATTEVLAVSASVTITVPFPVPVPPVGARIVGGLVSVGLVLVGPV